MIVIKWIIMSLIFSSTSILGLAMANKYRYRVRDLKEIRSILNIIETKMKYTYEPLPQIFTDISKNFQGETVNIFKTANEKMSELSAGEAWHYALENTQTNMTEEDIKTLEVLEKMLGKTDVEGQISEINLSKNYIDVQIKKAEEEQRKNEKLYKNLGVIVGIAIVILLI